MSEKVLKVLANCSQALTEEQKAQARSNIGCADIYTAGNGIAINGDVISNTAPNVKSDWNAATGSSAEILNKPSIGNGTLTIQSNGVQVAQFSANQSGNVTANITSGGADIVTRTNGQGGYVETSVSKLTLDTDFQQILTDNTQIGVFAPTPTIAATDKVLTVTAGSDAPVWTDKTKIVTRSAPYSTDVDITRMSIFDPGQSYGSVVQDQSSNTIGYFVPKYNAPADLGKVLTVVDDSGYKCKWTTPTFGYPKIDFMGHVTYNVNLSAANYLNMEDGVCYDVMSNAGGSFTLHLQTNSTTTVHSKIYLWGEQANCMSATIVYEDEGGEVSELQFVYGGTSATTIYALDVYARKVHVSGGISFDTTMCRVYDYPCASRDINSYNKDIGQVIEYVEP